MIVIAVGVVRMNLKTVVTVMFVVEKNNYTLCTTVFCFY